MKFLMNPWVLIGVAVAWALSIVGAADYWGGVQRDLERGEWVARDNAKLIKANAEILRLNNEARATEARRIDEMTILATSYSKGAQDAEERRRRDVAAARDGALVLRIPAAACGAGGGEAGQTGPPAPGRDAPATIELPREITADLFALADDADAIADQLRTCQQIALNDRKDSP